MRNGADELIGGVLVFGQHSNDPLPAFGSKNEPHDMTKKLSEKNVSKGIVSKSGTKIAIVDDGDDKASVFIETKSKNKILLDDDNKWIEL